MKLLLGNFFALALVAIHCLYAADPFTWFVCGALLVNTIWAIARRVLIHHLRRTGVIVV